MIYVLSSLRPEVTTKKNKKKKNKAMCLYNQ